MFKQEVFEVDQLEMDGDDSDEDHHGHHMDESDLSAVHANEGHGHYQN